MLANDLAVQHKLMDLTDQELEVSSEPLEAQFKNLGSHGNKSISLPILGEDDLKGVMVGACSFALNNQTATQEVVTKLFELFEKGHQPTLVQLDYHLEEVYFLFSDNSTIFKSLLYNDIVETIKQYGVSSAGISVSLSTCSEISTFN